MAEAEGADAQMQRGWTLQKVGDLLRAEAAFRAADNLGSPDGAFALGVLLRGRGDNAGAQVAYRRAEGRGSPRASCNLGVLLEEQGDLEGAKNAYRRADALDFAGGAFGLGQLLYDEGDLDGAIAAMRRADELGDVDATWNLGVMLENRGDLAEAEAAFFKANEHGHKDALASLGRMLRNRGDLAGAEGLLREADDRGDAEGAMQLGILLLDRSDMRGALAAFQRASDRGDDGAAEFVDRLREEIADAAGPPTPATSAAWVALRDGLIQLGFEARSDTVLLKTLRRGETGRKQRVFIGYELTVLGFEVVKIQSAFARIGVVDLPEVVREVGQLVVGSLGYIATADETGDVSNGVLTVGISIPLHLLDPSETTDIADIMVHVASLAGDADRMEERYGGAGDLY